MMLNLRLLALKSGHLKSPDLYGKLDALGESSRPAAGIQEWT